MMNKKSSLTKRMQVSYDSKGSGNASKKGVFNYKNLDDEVTFFKPQEGKNRINIIPYEIKTKNHPLVKKGEMEIGDSDYVMDFYVHKNIGPSETTVLCLKSTYGKPCPVCELQVKLRKEGKEDEAKALKPSRRVAYNIEDLKEPGKVKVFETSHYLFEKELIDEARDDEEGGFVDFADIENGKEIKFRASKVSQGGFEFLEFKSFGFESREDEISSKVVKKAISFDEIMEVPSYEEVEKVLYGSEDSDEEESEEEESVKSSKKHEEESEDEEDSKKKRSEEGDSDEEESEDEEDSDSKCPFGHKFGHDCDKSEDCDNCKIWDKCCKAKK